MVGDAIGGANGGAAGGAEGGIASGAVGPTCPSSGPSRVAMSMAGGPPCGWSAASSSQQGHCRVCSCSSVGFRVQNRPLPISAAQ